MEHLYGELGIQCHNEDKLLNGVCVCVCVCVFVCVRVCTEVATI